MIPKEIYKKVRKIEIYTKRLVSEIFSGGYKSAFKGKGMEFSEVREYIPGDDVRSIDWNVTARTGAPHVKKFEEERELSIIFLLDISGSTYFGTRTMLKKELAAEFVALLSFSAMKNNDNAGIIFFTDRIEKYIPASKGRSHILRLIREALFFKTSHKQTDLVKSLHYLNSVVKKRAIVFLISDFQTSHDFEHVLKLTNKRHDLVGVKVIDPAEYRIPQKRFFRFTDPESGKTKIIFTGFKKIRETFRQKRLEKDNKLRETFKSNGVDLIELSTQTDLVKPVLEFFEERKRRFH